MRSFRQYSVNLPSYSIDSIGSTIIDFDSEEIYFLWIYISSQNAQHVYHL